MSLKDGESELDSVVIRLLGTGYEIKSWDHMSLHSSFMVPCDELSFSLSGEDLVLAQEQIAAGAQVEVAINDRLQFSGYIDKKHTRYSRSAGSTLDVVCRDILGPVVNSNVDSKIRFSQTMTLLDVLAAVLVPFGIKTIYNDGSLNVSISSGAKAKPKLTSSDISVQIPKETLQKDGTVSSQYETVKAKAMTGSRPALSSLKINQLKPHAQEGAYAYCERMLKRFGLRMYAAADGSGVIVDSANFNQSPIFSLKHSKSEAKGNIKSADLSVDWECQPSCVVATGFGGTESSQDRRGLTVIMVNELVGTSENGEILPEIKNIIASRKGAKVLPLRKELIPSRKGFAARLVARPMFVKDDESRTIDQLVRSAMRMMAEKQHKAFHLKYQVQGLTQDGKPFTTNAVCEVNDEILGVTIPLWILEREFQKGRTSGTETNLTLVLPHSLQFEPT